VSVETVYKGRVKIIIPRREAEAWAKGFLKEREEGTDGYYEMRKSFLSVIDLTSPWK
jgi:hypothetical protein